MIPSSQDIHVMSPHHAESAAETQSFMTFCDSCSLNLRGLISEPQEDAETQKGIKP